MISKLISLYLLGVIGGAAIAMTPEMLTAVGAISVAIITAVGAVIVNVVVAKNVAKLKELAHQNLAETQVVKGHVNSAAAASEAKIDGLMKEIALMKADAADKKEAAALLAQSVATAPAKTSLT